MAKAQAHSPAAPKAKRDTGPERWARWANMVESGLTKAEVARREGVSRAAVTMGLRKLAAEFSGG